MHARFRISRLQLGPADAAGALACLVLTVGACVARLLVLRGTEPIEGGGDEWFSVWRSLQVLFERGNPGNFMHPALYYDAGAATYGALLANARVAGVYRDATDLLSAFVLDEGGFIRVLQCVSALFGGLGVAATYWLGRSVSGVRTGILAAGIVAVLPMWVEASMRARVDTLGAFTVTLALASIVRLRDRCGAGQHVVTGGAVGLAIAANWPGALTVVPLMWALSRGRDSPPRPAHFVAWLGLAIVVVFLATNPHVLVHPVAFVRHVALQASMGIRAHPQTEATTPTFYLAQLSQQGRLFVTILCAGLALAVIRGPSAPRVVAGFGVLYVAAMSLSATRFARYVVPALPALCVASVAGIESAVRSIRPPRIRAVLGAVLAVAASVAAFESSHRASAVAREARSHTGNWRERARLLAALSLWVRPGTRVWVESDAVPVLQVAFGDAGGALQARLRVALERVYPGFRPRVIKGEWVERVANLDPGLVIRRGFDVAIECGRARHVPVVGRQDAPRFYVELALRSRLVFSAANGCVVRRTN